MLKSPLYTLEWFVKCKNNEVAKFIDKTMKSFWRPHIAKVLRAMEYGYSGGEMIFKLEEDKVCFHSLKEFHPRDVRVLTIGHEFVGFRVKNIQSQGMGQIDLYPPKGFWFAVNREFGGLTYRPH